MDGVPTGELHEPGAQELVLRAAPALRWPELRARHVEQLRRLNALGLTGAHVMDGEPETFDLLRDLEGTDELTLRLRVPLWVPPDTSDDEQEAWLALRDERGGLWRGGVAKFFADGVIDAGTAWLEAPGHARRGARRRSGPTRSGWRPRWRASPARASSSRRTRSATRPCASRSARTRGRGGRGHRLEHLETLPDDLVQAIARSGYTASMQPVHLTAVGPGNWNERLGPERAARAFRMRDLLDAGAVLALGSDWPVADADPRLGMLAARRGTGADRRTRRWRATRSLPPAPSARPAGDPRRDARRPHRACSSDPVHAPDAPVWLTVVGGRVVHRALTPVAEAVP